MEHVAHPLIDALSEAHVVRQWWEGRWPANAVPFEVPARPDYAELDRLRALQGTGLSDREVLCSVLESQYADANMALPKRCADLKQAEARTVTTGHQLCLAMGPAFTWYKVMTAITLAARLETRWGTPVIPVFWLASEDHDFEEIASVWSGKEWHKWAPRAGSGRGGPVGRMQTQGMPEVLREWGQDAGLSKSHNEKLAGAVKGTLAQTMRRWMHQWFGADRLVVVDGDDSKLKAGFAQHMGKEWGQGVLATEVNRVNAVLEASGHSPQVHVREINLFCLSEGRRERIVASEGGGWTSGEFSWANSDAVREHLVTSPESVSPNALFRPLYQSWLLPDVAVVGGLAEVAYWLQLAAAYPKFGLAQPALVPRDGGWWMSAQQGEDLEAMGFTHAHLGQSVEAWEQDFIERQGPPDADHWRKALDGRLDGVLDAFKAADPALEGSVLATRAKMEKLLEKLDQQGRRAVRRSSSEDLERLRVLHAALHPQGRPQERAANLNVLLTDGEEIPFARLSELEQGMVEVHDTEEWTPKTHVWKARSA